MLARSKKAEISINLAFNIVSLLALIYLIRISSDIMAPAVFGIFMMARRYAGALANLLQLGVSQTLIRYIAYFSQCAGTKRRMLLMGGAIYISILLLVSLCAHYFDDRISLLLFGDEVLYVRVAFWTLLLAAVTVGGFVVYSTALAERRIFLANLINFMLVGGWLIVGLLYIEFNVNRPFDLSLLADILAFQVVSVGASSLCFSIYFLIIYRNSQLGVEPWRNIFGYYCSYGVPRTAITSLDGFTLAVGPWLLRGHPVEAGYLAVALSMLRMLQSILMPVAQLSGVYTAESLGASDETSVTRVVRMSVGVFGLIAIFTVAFLPSWMDLILQVWLANKETSSGVLEYSPLLIIALLPFMLFNGLKSIVEARWRSPRNLYSLIFSYFMFFISYYLVIENLGLVESISISYGFMFLSMGFSVIFWNRLYLKNSYRYFLYRDWVIAAVSLAFLSFSFRHYLGGWGFIPASIFAVMIFCALILKSRGRFFEDLRAHIPILKLFSRTVY